MTTKATKKIAASLGAMWEQTERTSQMLLNELPGPDPRVSMYTAAPVRDRDGSSHLWPFLTA